MTGAIRRCVQRRALAQAVAVSLLGASLAVTAFLPASASEASIVSVTVSVRQALTATFSDDGVLVSANVPWTLHATLPDAEPFTVSGGPCAERFVVVPEGAISVDVFPR